MADALARFKLGARRVALRVIDADHVALEAFLCSPDAQIAERVTAQIFMRPPATQAEWQSWLEECYRVAQHRGCTLSGWQLRFVIYHRVGRRLGMW